MGITDADKAKCFSSIVTMTFDPTKILLDITNENYPNVTNVTTTTINGKNYINSITLSIDAISSADIRFYKVDTSADYTYPNLNNNCVVTITTE